MEAAKTKTDFLKSMKQIKKIKLNKSSVFYLDAKHSALRDNNDE